MLNNKEKAIYMAAMIDGEGCITIAKLKKAGRGKDKRYEGRLTITNTNQELLKSIQEEWGGHIKYYKRFRPNWKPILVWEAGTKNAECILKAIYPYLRIKRGQADIVLNLRKTMNKYRGQGITLPKSLIDYREQLLQDIRKLNKRGI